MIIQYTIKKAYIFETRMFLAQRSQLFNPNGINANGATLFSCFMQFISKDIVKAVRKTTPLSAYTTITIQTVLYNDRFLV